MPSVVSFLVGVIFGGRFDINISLLVQRRLTALALVEVLRTTSEHIPFIRPEALTGPWNHDLLPQRAVLEDFQVGICNLLVSTRIGEDGIEIPPATCVVRCVEIIWRLDKSCLSRSQDMISLIVTFRPLKFVALRLEGTRMLSSCKTKILICQGKSSAKWHGHHRHSNSGHRLSL